MTADPAALTAAVLEEARALGFHRVGVARAEPSRRYRAFEEWLGRGMHGDMSYLATPEHRVGRADVRALLAGARSAVVVALAYDAGVVPAARLAGGPRGEVARYARGRDYHALMKWRLRDLADRLSERVGRPVAARPCVDTAPVLERDLAERAGLGFIGKNALLIAPGAGSYLLLGELLLDVELAPTGPEGEAPARCGTCRACLEACPTGAFVGPHVLDARRCISYLTIEHRGAIPRELREAIGTRVFGCDVCQEVCPFNAAAPARTGGDAEIAALADLERSAPDLVRLLSMGPARWRRFVGKTPLRRAGRDGLLRNACVALGNAGDRSAIPTLTAALTGDRSPLVRGHAAWALGRLGARTALESALPAERDPSVREEIEAALA
ncbi:MAG TPA: tRNA epoxyqueuosine(34) reductase QueG [Kofleriaceae bacterium]|nr:tRNA epoxyqueuosine(34) reductase QueG [Kofleriaceae bacterium]